MIYSELTQQAIDRIISTVGQVGKLDVAFDGALKDLVDGLSIDRGLIWRIAGAELTVTNQYSREASDSVIGNSMDCQESSLLVLDFLANQQDEHTPVLIEIDHQDGESASSSFTKFCQNYSSSILAHMPARGIMPGFLSLQSKNLRTWSSEERAALSQIAQVIGVLLSYEFEIARLKGMTVD